MQPDEYRRLAALEDEMGYFRALHAHVERVLQAGFAAGEAARVLDAGCGTGGLIRRLQARHPAWEWVGVDAEPLACQLARQRVAPGTRIELGRLEALPFPAAEFDAVVTADVLYHLRDDEQALHELARVLRPGGRLVVNLPAHRWLWSYHDVAVHGIRRYERGELRAKLRRAGFEPEVLTHWNALLLPLLALRRKLLPPPGAGSDVQRYPAVVEAGFGLAMRIEAAWLGRGGRLPFGSSLFAVAQKTA